MTNPHPSNLAASVRQRLANLATKSGEDFQRILTRYALERFAYRVSKSSYADRLILKGAMMFLVWSRQYGRPTRDLDFLGFGESSPTIVEAMFREISVTSVEPDAMEYLADSVRAELIRENQEYGGIRVSIEARLGTIKLPVRMDVGFGDVIVPGAVEAEFPTLLAMPAPHLRAYTRESVIAEKCEAMVKMGLANSRMKDFYDLFRLARDYEYEGPIIVQALQATFKRRGTVFPDGIPVALTPSFSRDPSKQKQWEAFVDERNLKDAERVLEITAEKIWAFLQGPMGSASRRLPFAFGWPADGPWH